MKQIVAELKNCASLQTTIIGHAPAIFLQRGTSGGLGQGAPFLAELCGRGLGLSVMQRDVLAENFEVSFYHPTEHVLFRLVIRYEDETEPVAKSQHSVTQDDYRRILAQIKLKPKVAVALPSKPSFLTGLTLGRKK